MWNNKYFSLYFSLSTINKIFLILSTFHYTRIYLSVKMLNEFTGVLKAEKKNPSIRAACHIPNPISRDRDQIFMGTLFRWQAI